MEEDGTPADPRDFSDLAQREEEEEEEEDGEEEKTLHAGPRP